MDGEGCSNKVKKSGKDVEGVKCSPWTLRMKTNKFERTSNLAKCGDRGCERTEKGDKGGNLKGVERGKGVKKKVPNTMADCYVKGHSVNVIEVIDPDPRLRDIPYCPTNNAFPSLEGHPEYVSTSTYLKLLQTARGADHLYKTLNAELQRKLRIASSSSFEPSQEAGPCHQGKGDAGASNSRRRWLVVNEEEDEVDEEGSDEDEGNKKTRFEFGGEESEEDEFGREESKENEYEEDEDDSESEEYEYEEDGDDSD